MKHRLDWNGWKGVARCTGCQWVEVVELGGQSRARFLHDQHQADQETNP